MSVLLTMVVGPIVIVGVVILTSTDHLANNWLPIVLVTTLSSALAALIVVRLGERLVRPLARLSRMLADGPASGVEELDYLQPLDDDPAEVEQVKVALLRQVRRLDAEARSRATVAAAITHDLRTPLIAILRAIDARADSPEDGDLTTPLLANVRLAADEARVLSTQLLDVLQYGSGAETLRFVTLSLGDIAARSVARVQDDARRRDIEVVIVGDGIAVGDVHAVSRAVANLVENAVRHARRRIVVRVFDGMVRVEDDGSGLPTDLANLIEPFVGNGSYRVGEPYVPHGLAGLGLFIVDRIARAHGGKLTVESSGERGTALLLYLSGIR